MTDRQRHGFVLLLVAGLIAASAVILTQFKTVLGLDLKGGVELVYQAQPTPQSPVNQTSLVVLAAVPKRVSFDGVQNDAAPGLLGAAPEA